MSGSAFLNPPTEMSQSDVSTEEEGHAITTATLSNPRRLHQKDAAGILSQLQLDS